MNQFHQYFLILNAVVDCAFRQQCCNVLIRRGGADRSRQPGQSLCQVPYSLSLTLLACQGGFREVNWNPQFSSSKSFFH